MRSGDLPLYSNYVDGQWVESQSGEIFHSLNPATGESMATLQRSSVADAHHAIEAARRAFDSGVWPDTAPGDRAKVLFEFSRLLHDEEDRLARLFTMENGKPLDSAKAEIRFAAEVAEYYGGLTRTIAGEASTPSKDALSIVLKEPVGVCALIPPWNFPVQIAVLKLAPALAAGCTLILKPATYTPAIDMELVKLFDRINSLPKGVVNAITGPGSTVGAELVKSHDVDKVALTGETETGKQVMQMASGNIKKVSLELGGKAPNIVFADADMEKALQVALWGIFSNAGQSCAAYSRLLVEEGIHEDFVRRLADLARRLRVGNGLDPDTEMGPMISERQMNTILKYVQAGEEEGAQLACGGKRLEDGELAKGFFVEPTIFDDVSNDMTIAREEVFGPFLSVIPFEDEDQAVEIANDTIYGLVSAICSRDLNRVLRTAMRIRAGTVLVNSPPRIFPQTPFAGYKQSGLGVELGREALEEYLETKHVCFKVA